MRILDVGCGINKLPGSIGIDRNASTRADVLCDLDRFPYPFRDASFDRLQAIHLIEHISRPDFNTLHYEVTIDDPGAYTRPWTASWNIPWTTEEVEEYFCQDNNKDTGQLVGGDAP